MRHFAGPLAHKLSPVGLLWLSCLMASTGLLLLSVANSPMTGILAATGLGDRRLLHCGRLCWAWLRKDFLVAGTIDGLMGTGGTLSIYFVLPQMGSIFDHAKIRAAGGDEAFKALSGDKLNDVLVYASQHSFRMGRHPACHPVVCLRAIWLYDKFPWWLPSGENPPGLACSRDISSGFKENATDWSCSCRKSASAGTISCAVKNRRQRHLRASMGLPQKS